MKDEFLSSRGPIKMERLMTNPGKRRCLNIIALIITLSIPNFASATTLTLQQFLEQVKTGNDGYKASKSLENAAPDKAVDADMVYAPNLFATLQSAIDKKEVQPVSQRGSETDYSSAQIGVSKLTSFGTALRAYYSASHTKIKGTSPQFVPEPEWREASPTIEISQPLWKNAFGNDVANMVVAQRGQAEITQLNEALKQKMTLAEAEGVYWRLALARESLRIAKDNLDRAKKIVDWTKRRVGKELADNADLLQSDALEELRQIELKMAIDEERSSAFIFNTIRGNNAPGVPEELMKLTPDLLNNLENPKRSADREDVKAAEKASEIAQVLADISSSKYQPSIDLFASGTLNGRDATSNSKASTAAFKAKHPTYAFGLKISAVLGGDSFSRLRAGVANERQASALVAARRRYESDREWVDLSLKLQESRLRLGLTQKIEATQLKKLTAERNRQSRGRSTMFQVMQAETDYASSQLNVIRNKAEILGIMARIKTFGGEK